MSAAAFYLSDDVTLATGLTFSPGTSGTPLQTGDETAETELHLWNTASVGGAETGPLSIYDVVKDALGNYKSSGLDALDEGWLWAKEMSSCDSTGDASFFANESEWTRLSPGARLEVDSIPAACARYLSIKWVVPQGEGLASETVEFALRQIHDEASTTLTVGIAKAFYGILTGAGHRSFTEWIDPPTVTESGTPDDVINIGWSWFLERGVPYWIPPGTLSGNQTAADGALGSGQEYVLLVTHGWGTTTYTGTKGNRATSGLAVPPAVPASHSVAAVVRVAYGAGGSVITNAAITVRATPARFKPYDADGTLVLTVGRGWAMNGGLTARSLDVSQITLPDDTSRYVWRTSGGLYLTTTFVPPAKGDIPIAYATTAGGVITSIEDRRLFLSDMEREIALFFDGTETTGPLAGMKRQAGRSLAIDRIRFTIEDASGGTGITVLDINRKRAGTSATIFPNQAGSVESRPTVAAGSRGSSNAMPEITRLRDDDVLSIDCDTATSDTSAAGLGVTFVCVPVAYE